MALRGASLLSWTSGTQRACVPGTDSSASSNCACAMSATSLVPNERRIASSARVVSGSRLRTSAVRPASAASIAVWRAIGVVSVSDTRVPSPGALCSSSVARIRSASRRQIASPKPLPP